MSTPPIPVQPLIAEPDSPPWFKRFVLRLANQFVGKSDILFLQGYVSTALPDPVRYYDCMISVTDKGVPAYSNGVNWYPVQLGAHY